MASKEADRNPDTPATARGRGRPRGFAEEAALEAAMLTFWRNGYQATSLDDIVAATGAARASLYKTFGDKRAMFLKSLALYGSRFEARAEQALGDEPNARDAVQALLAASADRLTGGNAPPGCLRCNSTLELMGTDPVLDTALTEANERFQQVIQKILDHGIRKKQLRKKDANGLARYITGAINGMVTLARTGADRSELMEYADHVMKAWPD